MMPDLSPADVVDKADQAGIETLAAIYVAASSFED